MRCIFTGGGTLGHTNPAIAVAEQVRKEDNGAEILFVVRENGKENEAIIKRGFEIKEIPSKGLSRSSNIMAGAQTAATAIRGILHCMKIIKSFQPDFIFGTGGYVSFAPLVAGTMLRIPTFVHESNSVPGLVTKITTKLGATPLVNMEATKEHLKSKKTCHVVGMPTLPDFDTISKSEARRRLGIGEDKVYVISFGGSGGSSVMNDTVLEIMRKRNGGNRILHLHATGEKYFDFARKKYPALTEGKHGQKIVARIENMALHMSAADIVICRCGAATLSEISSLGKAAILIPSPNVTNNHQYENGKCLSNKSAAIMIEENLLTEILLNEKINLLANSEYTRKTLEKNASRFKKGNAAKAIYSILPKNG